MEAVNRGAKDADRNALTIGVLPDSDKKRLSDCVDVGIVTGMGSARNNINILSSDVVIACGHGGSGTASEIALALKSEKQVILLNERPESGRFFATIAAIWCTRPTVSKRRSPLSRPYYPRSKISHPQGCLSEQTFAQAHKKQMRFTAVSALGQKQTFAVQKGMSALPPIAT